MMKKKILALALALSMALSLAACGGSSNPDSSAAPDTSGKTGGAAGETTVWKLASDGIVESSAAYYVAMEVKRLVEEKSNGTIQVDVYNQGEIGDSIQQIEMTQTGSVDLLVSAIGNFGGIVPESQVFSLHFLLTGDDGKDVAFLNSDNEGMRILNQKFEDKGLHMLSWWSEGYNLWTGNKALNTVDSWKGVKMRTMASPIIMAVFDAYGANSTVIAYSELYSASQLHTVEAQCNSPMIVYGSNFYEVQDAMTEANADVNLSTFTAGISFYNGLNDEQKTLLKEVADELAANSVTIVGELNSDSMEKIAAAGKEIFTIGDAEREKFKTLAEGAYDAYVSEVGGDAQSVLDAVMEGLK
nr:TRAP transporter substrate-binding protein DctP [uncultured Oscillibacter sp.]